MQVKLISPSGAYFEVSDTLMNMNESTRQPEEETVSGRKLVIHNTGFYSGNITVGFAPVASKNDDHDFGSVGALDTWK